MGSIINRGTKANPKWYVQYQENGRQKMERARVTSKEKARGFLRAAEERIRVLQNQRYACCRTNATRAAEPTPRTSIKPSLEAAPPLLLPPIPDAASPLLAHTPRS